MLPTNLGLTALELRVQARARDITCCTGITCCIRNTEMPDDLVTLKVHNTNNEGLVDEVEISSSTIVVYDKGETATKTAYLRPRQSNDIKWPKKKEKADRLNKDTIKRFYKQLVHEKGVEAAAIVAAWKNIDFVFMFKHAYPLQISHLVDLQEGFVQLEVPKVQKIFNRIIDYCTFNANKKVCIDLDNQIVKSEVMKNLKVDKKRTDSLNLIDEETIGVSEHNLELVGQKVIQIAIEKGIIKEELLTSIGNKLRALRNSVRESKSLEELSKGFLHLTKDDAENLIGLTTWVESGIKKVAKKNRTSPPHEQDESEKLKMVLETFAEEPVRAEFRKSSTGENLPQIECAVPSQSLKKRTQSLPTLSDLVEQITQMKLNTAKDKEEMTPKENN